MQKTYTYQINFKGGIVSPGVLQEVLQAASDAQVREVRFGLRQQLLLDVPATCTLKFEKACKEQKTTCALQKEAAPNILSSYPAAGLFNKDTWLREGVYKDIFNQFDANPSLKINICDSTQNLVPFFSGHINWISAPEAHFWYLYIRFPKTQTLYCWPELIYTNDIAHISKRVEAVLKKDGTGFEATYATDGARLFSVVKECGTCTSKIPDTPLSLPKFSLPYYEGFNKEQGGLWLGLYRRNEAFPVAFLRDVCALCTIAKIGQLYTTPWKSLIIKGIEPAHTEQWNWVLGKYRINVRHAANELAWQVEDGDPGGLLIKRYLIREFDKEDVRTFGLSFGVQSRPTSSMFGSIIIRKQQNRNPHRLKSLERFDLLHTQGFNPNATELVLFREGLEKEQLGTYLISLCKMYYEQQEANLNSFVAVASPPPVHTQPVKQHMVHQCRHCLTVYDSKDGDTTQHIAAGTLFKLLPENYVCATCESSKEDFLEVAANVLELQVL